MVSSSNMNRFNVATSLIALLVFQLVTNPLVADAQQIIPPLIPQRVNVAGQLCCTSSGNCPGLGLANTTVNLNCTILGVSVVVANGTTNATGFFNITVPGLLSIPLGSNTLPCVLTAGLPLNSTVCPILNTATGILVSAVQLVGNVVSSVFGLIPSFSPTLFVNLQI